MCRTDLAEKVSRELFLQNTFLGDEIKQILAWLRSLHHDDEAVVSLEEVNEFDNTINVGDSLHQTNLQRYSVHSDLELRHS